MSNNIFNRQKLRVNRNRAAKNIIDNLFFTYVVEDIIERLSSIDNKLFNIVDLGCRTGSLTKRLISKYKDAKVISTDISETMLQCFEHEHKLLIDEENLLLDKNTIDLISFCLGLHWINDIPEFLAKIKYMLKSDGIFIANFIGGDSFKKLRLHLIQAELETGNRHFPHIPPFIRFDHITPLLLQAGFAEIIVDYENIELHYDSPLDLMKELKHIGESNILNSNNHENYTISKSMISILSDNTHDFYDQIHLISLITSPSKNSIKLKL